MQVYYGATHAIKDVDVDIEDKNGHRLHRPVGAAASRPSCACINRMNDTIDICRVEGDILIDGERTSTTSGSTPCSWRAKVGMVFQKPNPFPKSIYDNVAYGHQDPRHGQETRPISTKIVEKALRRGAIWDEVKDAAAIARGTVPCPAASSSGLCIARAVATEPEVLLDGRAVLRASDPIATAQVEELDRRAAPELFGGDSSRTSMQQPARVSQKNRILPTWAIWCEYGETEQIFSPTPKMSAPNAM